MSDAVTPLEVMPFEGYQIMMPDTWLDVNDHMNARFYSEVIYEAHAKLTNYLGLGDDYVAATQNGKVVVESHLIYEREIRRGATLGVRSWLLDLDDKRLHFGHELLDLSKGVRAAFCEQMDLHVDLNTRRVSPIPAPLRLRLAGIAETGRPRTASLPVGRSLRQLNL